MNTASFRVSMFLLLGALSIAFLATADPQPKEEYVTGGEKGGGWEIYKNPDGESPWQRVGDKITVRRLGLRPRHLESKRPDVRCDGGGGPVGRK